MFRNANLSDSVVEEIEKKYGKVLDSGKPVDPMVILISETENLDKDDVKNYIMSREKNEGNGGNGVEFENEDGGIEDEAAFLPGSDIAGWLRSALKYKYVGPDRSSDLHKGVEKLYNWGENRGGGHIHEIVLDISKNLVLVLCGKVETGIEFDDISELNDQVRSISGRLNHLFGINHVLPSKGGQVHSKLVLKGYYDSLKDIEEKAEDISKKFDNRVDNFKSSNPDSIKGISVLIENFMIQMGKMKSVLHSIRYTRDQLELIEENLHRDDIQESIDAYKNRRETISLRDFLKRIKHNLNAGLGTEKQREEMESIVEEISSSIHPTLSKAKIQERIDESKERYSLGGLLDGEKFIYSINNEKRELNLKSKLSSLVYTKLNSRVEKEGEERVQAILGDQRFRPYIGDFKIDAERNASENGDRMKFIVAARKMAETIFDLVLRMENESYSIQFDDLESGEKRLVKVMSGNGRFTGESEFRMNLLDPLGERVFNIGDEGEVTINVGDEDGDNYQRLASNKSVELIEKLKDMFEKSVSELKPVEFTFKRGGKDVKILTDKNFLGARLDELADQILRVAGKKTDPVISLEKAEKRQLSDKMNKTKEIVKYYRMNEDGKSKLDSNRKVIFDFVEKDSGKRPSSFQQAESFLKESGHKENDGTIGGKILKSTVAYDNVVRISGEDGHNGIPIRNLNRLQMELMDKFVKSGLAYEEDGEFVESKDVVSPEQEAIRDSGDIIKEVGEHLSKAGIKMTDEIKKEIKRDFIQSMKEGTPRDSFVNGYVKSYIRHHLGSDNDVLGISYQINHIIDEIENEYGTKYPKDDRKVIEESAINQIKKNILSESEDDKQLEDNGQSIDDTIRLLKDGSLIRGIVEISMDIHGFAPDEVSKTAGKLASKYLSSILGG